MSENSSDPCPVLHTSAAIGSRSNRDWWPDQVNLKILSQHGSSRTPLGDGFRYSDAIKELDVDALKKDLIEVMTTSQTWWPADYGHYGPLFIRMAWHSAGTYRVADGRGGASRGAQRFAPINSWPDNANLDKARRLLWPIKQRYGSQISWADLIMFAGNVALESMGFRTFGFGFGREDIWEADDETYWGPENIWLGDERYSGDRELANPLGAVQMGLIYVNPEGPNGDPDPLAAAKDIRETFARMAMNDEETVALIVGGHTFGKTHGAVSSDYVGPAPEGAPLEQQGLGWKNQAGSGVGDDSYTSGLEGAWTNDPITWDNGFLDNLFKYDWELTSSPSGARQWTPKDPSAKYKVPDAHDPSKRHAPMMLTTDLALKVDPIYEPIARSFYNHPHQLEDRFAKAWFKLIHRDMGPVTRYLGPLLPAEPQMWQDPVPKRDYDLIGDEEIASLKQLIMASNLSVAELVTTAWASASTYRGTDRRGGANGARIRLLPQSEWTVNEPARLRKVLDTFENIQRTFNGDNGSVKVSIADLIVLGGCTAIEEAARRADITIDVPFTPGRTDATQEQTDSNSFAVLEPGTDGFRNYVSESETLPAEYLLVERANLLTLTAQEMTALLGGMRVLGANFQGSTEGVFTDSPETLTNDFFTNLLDMRIQWSSPSKSQDGVYLGHDRESNELKWTATAVDLVFGSNAQLRALAELYAFSNSKPRFVHDFVAAWGKVMDLDRFDME